MCDKPVFIAKKALMLFLVSITAVICGCATYNHDQASQVAGLMNGYQIAVDQDRTVHVQGATPAGWDFSDWRDIKSVSVGSHNAVGVRYDGTVVVTGDNTFDTCDTESWRNIRMAEANSYAVYGLRNDGTVISTEPTDNTIDWAHQIKKSVDSWTDIVSIDCSDFGIVGLKKDGTVVTAIPAFSDFADEASRWTNVASISISFNTIVGVTKSGKPLFSTGSLSQPGQDEYTAPFKEMTGAVKICAGYSFVAGLWPDGSVKVASTIPLNPYHKDLENMTFEERLLKRLPDFEDFTRAQWQEVHQYTMENMPEDLKAINKVEQAVDINSYEDSLIVLLKDGTILAAGTVDDEEDD